MKKRIIFDDTAAQELELSANWYDRERAGLGGELLELVATIFDGISAGTATAQPVAALSDSTIRQVFLDRFPYAVVYVETEEAIHVVAVAHLRRSPRYWRRRIPKRP